MLRVEGVTVHLGGVPVLEDVWLSAEPGHVTAVLGPSGSGKTTLLRTVAGLVRPVRGRVLLDGHDVTALPAHERGVGLMFQDHALLPHRDVEGNIAFGLRMRGWEPAERRRRVDDMLALVGLAGANHRSVQELSGGERQRVALARALAPEPAVLMLDEPLGSLDPAIRERLLDELGSIVEGLANTVLYVTHDTGEAFRLADVVALLHAGRVVQTGAPADVWRMPADEEAARLLGHTNVVHGRVKDGRLDLGWAVVPSPAGSPVGASRFLLRTDGLTLDTPGERPAVEGIVRRRRFQGDRVALAVEVAPDSVLEAHALVAGSPRPGERVALVIDPEAVVRLGPPQPPHSPTAEPHSGDLA